MPAAELSRNRVEERLGALEEAYASFTVDQTTLSVSPAAYERARERCDRELEEVYVRVYNEDDDVLLVQGNGEWVVPRATPDADVPLERGACDALAEQTGVECRITGLERVTILGLRHEEDPDRAAVYRLVPVFVAERTAGSPDANASWTAEEPDPAIPAH